MGDPATSDGQDLVPRMLGDISKILKDFGGLGVVKGKGSMPDCTRFHIYTCQTGPVPTRNPVKPGSLVTRVHICTPLRMGDHFDVPSAALTLPGWVDCGRRLSPITTT